MLERLRVMLFKEFVELRRDFWAMFRLVVPLVIQLIVFGYAATFTVNHVSTAVLDLDNTQASRSLVSHFVATGRFDIVDVTQRQRDITSDINTGKATLAIVIHSTFAQRLNNGQTAPLQIIVDGTNSNTALIALGYVSQIAAQFNAEQRTAGWTTPATLVARAAPPMVNVALEERPWFNASLIDTWFFIPGIIGTLTLVQVVNLTSFAIVRERETGTLEQIMVSPMTSAEYILGKTVPFFLIGLADVALITLIGILWFHIPFVDRKSV